MTTSIFSYIKPLSLRMPLQMCSLKDNNKTKHIYKIRFENNNNNDDNEFDLYKYRLFTLKVCALFVYIHFFLTFYPY